MDAAAVLPLTGRYAFGGRGAAAGLAAWAAAAGVRLRVEDCGEDPAAAARLTAAAATGCDVLFGPYGSGLARAAAAAAAPTGAVLWNHGAAAVPDRTGRIVDVLAPAGRYWTGLPGLLGPRRPPWALLWADTGFGREVAAGARAVLTAHGAAPVLDAPLTEAAAPGLVRSLRRGGARLVVGCGRLEDDLALGRALAGGDEEVALVACGVPEVAAALGPAVVGWVGASQWPPDGPPCPIPLPAGAGYPAAQAVAAGMIAARALEAAGTRDPAAVWEAVLALRTETFLGPFAVDGRGRQTAATPSLVRWEPGPGGPVMRTAWRPPPPPGGPSQAARAA